MFGDGFESPYLLANKMFIFQNMKLVMKSLLKTRLQDKGQNEALNILKSIKLSPDKPSCTFSCGITAANTDSYCWEITFREDNTRKGL